jgi:hypothetical protein
MAAWRRAIELSLGDSDVEKLRMIAWSRTEPASRVERARILLGYWENSSFFAVGQALGLHHQTVQRCVERAVAEGPIAALDDRPRPGILESESALLPTNARSSHSAVRRELAGVADLPYLAQSWAARGRWSSKLVAPRSHDPKRRTPDAFRLSSGVSVNRGYERQSQRTRLAGAVIRPSSPRGSCEPRSSGNRRFCAAGEGRAAGANPDELRPSNF